MAALEQLEDGLRRAPPGPASSGRSCASSWRTFAGRPTRALPRRPPRRRRPRGGRRVSPATGRGAPGSPRLRLYLKREDLAHTGAHKINNALGQALLTRRLGKTRVIAETGAGQHGVATATACALLDLPCVVYMGAEDIERQGPNVLRMRALGAEVRSVTSGHGDAQGRGQRGDARLGDERRDDPLRARLGDGPAPVPDDRPRPPAPDRRRGRGPARRRRGPAARPRDRLRRRRFERDRAAGPVHRRAVGPARGRRGGRRRHRDRAPRGGDPRRDAGHPPRLALADAPGRATARSTEAHSASAGLDYPGIGPQLAALAEGGRIEVAAATDREAVAAMKATTRTEGILPALETAHAIAALPRLLAGIDGLGRLVAGRGARPPRLLRTRRQGPRRARAVRRRRAVGERPMTTRDGADRAATGTNDDRRRPADRRGVRPRPGRGPRRAHPVRRRRLPGRRHELRDRPRRGRRRRRPARGRPAVLGPARRRRDAPARVAASRSPPARRSSARSRLIERIGAARPDLPLVPMGYANQVIGGGDGEAVARRLAGAGAAGLIVADLTPDEGAPFEAVARDAGLAVVYLVAPTTPRRPPRRGRRPERRLPLLRLARRRHRRPDLAAGDGRQARPRRQGRLARPGRGRLRRQPAGPRPGDREGRRRRRHRRLGARRRPRAGRPRRRAWRLVAALGRDARAGRDAVRDRR